MSRHSCFAAVLFGLGFALTVWIWHTNNPSRPARLADPPSARLSQKARRATRYEYADWCDMHMNAGGWVGIPHVSCDSGTLSVATCGEGHADNWQWSSEALRCGAHRLAAQEVQSLLQDKWLVVAGDSITRFFFASLLRLLGSTEQVVFGHRDFEYTLGGNIRATFAWAPYAANISGLLSTWSSGNTAPDLLVASAGLWHMLHIRLKTADKQQHLTQDSVDGYNSAIINSQILLPDGPFFLLDMHRLSQGCGAQCTHDGLHYSNATYDAALQIWVNNVRLYLAS
ncbi:hypothetical protein WJX72_003900 [[Myrmecia] bisecta]|uniref:Uncharacterized protein n=1 Tax=[Myrmecia] bisecta TaxID=41462 RepID=A0AAW1PLI4_9CHLO